MSKKSATDTIKKLNPKNISGTIPQALDLIRSLRDSKGNPTMAQAVGLANLIGMLKFVSSKFNKAPPVQKNILDEIIRILKKIRPINIPEDVMVNIGLELLGFNELNISINYPTDKLNLIADTIKGSQEIKNLLSDSADRITLAIEHITIINKATINAI